MPRSSAPAAVPQHCRTGSAGWAFGLAVLLCLSGCSDISWPWSRSSPSPAPTAAASGDGNDAECASLRSEIKNNEERSREAPTQSTSPEIVEATQAKAGQQVDELRARYDALDCQGQADPRYRRAPVTPAPGSASTQ